MACDDYRRLLISAFDRMMAQLRQWEHDYGNGEDWLRRAEVGLKQIRGEFRGAVAPVFAASRAKAIELSIREILVTINEQLTFVAPIDPPADAGGLDEDELVDVDTTSEPRLDWLIRTIPNLPDLATDNVEPEAWPAFMDQAIDMAAEIAGIALRLRNGLSANAPHPSVPSFQSTTTNNPSGHPIKGVGHRPEKHENAAGEHLDRPDDKGFVANPSDPTAYMSFTQILHRDETAHAGIATERKLRNILDRNQQIRRYRPNGHPQRLSIHLGDWSQFLRSHQHKESDSSEDPSKEVIYQKAADIRAKRR